MSDSRHDRTRGAATDAGTDAGTEPIVDASLEAVLADYDFCLPEERIAQVALDDREASRLLVLEREHGSILEADHDHHVRDLPRWLEPGDLLVLNTTRVLPARLLGRKASGGLAEALLLGSEPTSDDTNAGPRFRALVKCTGRLRRGLVLVFSGPGPLAPCPAPSTALPPSSVSPNVEAANDDDRSLEAEVVALHGRGEVTLRFAKLDADPYAIGVAPLPPYIRRTASDPAAPDLARYQTVYAREPGAVAAPTAGLHLTPSLLERLRTGGVETAEVVLHVGAGTFRPLDATAWQTGRLHRERYRLPSETVERIEATRRAGGRIVAVGTTTTRVLEGCAGPGDRLVAGEGETDLFLRPGAPFRVVDALLTNFHLPRSSLLMLVSAFAGREAILAAYHHAIERKFRFFSYGDAMLILSRRRPQGAREDQHAG